MLKNATLDKLNAKQQFYEVTESPMLDQVKVNAQLHRQSMQGFGNYGMEGQSRASSQMEKTHAEYFPALHPNAVPMQG